MSMTDRATAPRPNCGALTKQYPFLRHRRARGVVRPVGGGAQRRRVRARADRRRRSTATARTIRRFCPPSSRRSSATPTVGLVAGQRVGRKATGFKKLQSRIANAVRGAVLARRHPRHRLRPQGGPARRVPGAALFRRAAPLPAGAGAARRLLASPMSTWSIARACTGASNYGLWDRLWVGILDLMGVWWLIRRKKRVPQVSEVARDAG